ncbi:MAG: translation initiation factor IF-2 [Candidatus Deianiraeaceae bacterium]|jgi:translation initiation factor IF-2
MSIEDKTKISLSTKSTKISLSSIGMSKEDILKKFIHNEGSSPIVHKNVEQIRPKEVETHHTPSQYTVSNQIIDHDFTNEAPPVIDSTVKKIRKIGKQQQEITNIKIPTRFEIKADIIPKKKKDLPKKEDVNLFGANTNEEKRGIVITVDNTEEEKKEDLRDKSIIDKHLQHYKYLEFDNEEEIQGLQSGENLREILSQQREKTQEEEIEIISTFNTEDRNRRRKKTNTYGRVKRKSGQANVHSQSIREIHIPDFITADDLSDRLALKVKSIIDKAHHIGEHIKHDTILDGDVAELIVEEFGHKVIRVKEKTPEDVLSRKASETKLETVPPVVTIMGHVDHGKTSLLDALRKTDVALGESGGITQAIGAYQVTLQSGRKITFIDTPGHEAFTAMRARGANATDIIVLVVASDDSINTQTIEAIHHAKAAQCPIIVAVNKMDLPEANLKKVKEDLLSHDLIPEDFGGDIAVIPVSALKKTGLDILEEQILLHADMLDLKANYLGHAGGIVLESRLDNKQGAVATVLIKHGILKVGNIILAGTTFGRARKILDDRAQELSESLPSMPVEIYGFSNVPQAGERFFVLENEKSAREVVQHRIERARDEINEDQSNEDPFASLLNKAKNEVNVIIRCDMQGSVDAIKHSLAKIDHNDVKLNIIHILSGNVTEADILLAKNNATIFAFNVSVGSSEELVARKNTVEIREHSIIYKLIDEIKELLSKSLSPITVETKIGEALVRQVFDISKTGKIAGMIVQDGAVKKGALAKVIRDGALVTQGIIKTLKHFQEDVKSVQQGKECGMQIEKTEDLKNGDIVEIYNITYAENKVI